MWFMEEERCVTTLKDSTYPKDEKKKTKTNQKIEKLPHATHQFAEEVTAF